MQISGMRAVSLTPQNLRRASSRELSEWSTQSKLLLGAGSVALLALAVIAALPLYTRYQNGRIQIEDIHCDCDRGFSYYNGAAHKKWAAAADEYCLAQMFETGNGTKRSLSEARKWYKKAYEQGLNAARKSLCDPNIYEHRYGNDEEYKIFKQVFKDYDAEYQHTCCPITYPCDSQSWINRMLFGPGTNCVLNREQCPWETRDLSGLKKEA